MGYLIYKNMELKTVLMSICCFEVILKERSAQHKMKPATTWPRSGAVVILRRAGGCLTTSTYESISILENLGPTSKHKKKE